MNMFSMKPKFDLAAFLAEPAPKGAARKKNMRRGGMQMRPAADATAQPNSDAPAPKDDAKE